MKKGQLKECEDIVQSLSTCKTLLKEEELRNKLFEILNPFILMWMSSVLKKKGMYLEKSELLSVSWDCFEFCLKHYKIDRNIPIPNHFYSYTRFYLSTAHLEKGKKDKRYGSSQEFSNGEQFDILDELKKFRSCLDKEYESVFDDALMSMRAAPKDRTQRLGVTTLSYHRYHEMKKIFKVVIDFLLRR